MPSTYVFIGLALFAAGFLLGRIAARGDRTVHFRSLPDVRDSDVETLVREGRTIEAIKVVRTRKGLGLKEAKAVVDTIAARIRPMR